MSDSLLGEPIHGELSSSDASGGVDFTLFNSGGDSTRTLKSNERVVITDINGDIGSGAGGVVRSGSGGTGKTAAHLPADSIVDQSFLTPFYCGLGETPSYNADGAGQVDIVLQGVIIQS
jgi:hypothetical protein